ncbi:hypothetical protein LDENG_00167650 [Lucifuga dentata]|nr:hypothetical protein LDENG_00167650 [Lucifuga dentata]
MSSEVHFKRQRTAKLRTETSSSPLFAPHVPTVTLISHRELRDKQSIHRLQPGSLDPNLATSSHYRCSEGRSLSFLPELFYGIFWQRVSVMSD